MKMSSGTWDMDVTWNGNDIVCTNGLTIQFQANNLTLKSVSDFMGNECGRDSNEWKDAEIYMANEAVKEAKKWLNSH